MIKSDFHIHSKFSVDSKSEIEDIVLESIKKSCHIICITDHADYNPYDDGYNFFDPDNYFIEIEKMRKKYSNRIKILAGMEFGEVHQFQSKFNELKKEYDFDFIIGSAHMVDDYFISKNELAKKYSSYEICKKYFEVLKDMVSFGSFSVLGHLDFPKRYFKNYDGRLFEREIEDILKIMVKHKIGIEINTSSLRKGYKETMPNIEIIEKYISYGGEYITLGSDAHNVKDIATPFESFYKYQNISVEF